MSALTVVRVVKVADPRNEADKRTDDLSYLVAVLDTIARGRTVPSFWANYAAGALARLESSEAREIRLTHARMAAKVRLAPDPETAERCAMRAALRKADEP